MLQHAIVIRGASLLSVVAIPLILCKKRRRAKETGKIGDGSDLTFGADLILVDREPAAVTI